MCRRILLILAVIILPLLGLFINSPVPVKAATSADITVTATPDLGGATQPPTDFMAVFIVPRQVNLLWTLGVSANNTMIRAKFYDYPINTSDGYMVYYGGGESANDTSLDLDITFGPVYYSAWSENGTGAWSTSYATASTENPELEEIAEQLELFVGQLAILAGLFPLLLTFLPLALVSILAFWKQNAVLFIITGAVSIAVGLYWYDAYTTNVGMAIGLGIIAYSLLCLGLAFRLIFWREDILE